MQAIEQTEIADYRVVRTVAPPAPLLRGYVRAVIATWTMIGAGFALLKYLM